MRTIIIISACLIIALFSITSSLKGEEQVTIDNLKYSELICGDDIQKEDLEGHVVGIKYWKSHG